MNDQPQNAARAANPHPFPEPGVPVIRSVNWPGARALYLKEVRRFMKVQLQTVWAPAVTTLMFLIIFTLALGGAGRTVLGVPFPDFIAPGLMIMGMMNNSFANSSFSLLAGKMQGTLVDYLMPPLSTGELLFSLVAAAITRAFMVGGALWIAMALWPGVHVAPAHLWAILWFGLMGAALTALIGVLTSIWADKFDHAAAINNFVIGPMTLLSGTFYSIDSLSPLFRAISHANPFFYAISGFRYGFVSATDGDVLAGSIVLLALNIALAVVCYALLRRGWKIKA
ncbi:ABC-2 type transport system permease protein [Sphingobium fontiphilum]|uniref:Transport permease protein n=1 Tax=Sphingobium fontiphilum TaxID=944425 RepID=A0A7W6DGH0_9SPHN|nr:ABC transporter permease [Sphingobium fontiphilum]MBB3980861.1 ABC-2 type transport system permease protein [Sphingobium fontiphilum]